MNFVIVACAAGLLVGLSRQLNGRLSFSSSPLIASFWNHFVGVLALTAFGFVFGGMWPAGAREAPWLAYIGGPIGVGFVALSSWLVTRIGAINTALLVIAGQMIAGLAIDLLEGGTSRLSTSSLGVILIIAGAVVAQRRSKPADRDSMRQAD